MIETYRNMELVYTSRQPTQKDVLSQEHFLVTLSIDRQNGESLFTDEKEEKTMLQYVDAIEFLNTENAFQITVYETDGTVWVFIKKGSDG